MNLPMVRGMAMVVAAAMLWGTTGTAQSLAPPQLSSYWVGALRLVVAALFFSPLLWLSDPQALRAGALRRLPWPGIALAAVCVGIYNLAFFAGVRAEGVAVGTAVALGSGPVWAGLLRSLFSRSLPSPAWWLGTGVAVAGVLLCLLAGLAYAAYALVNQGLVAGASPAAVTTAVFSLAAVLALPCALGLSGVPQLQADDAAVLLWLGVVSTGIAYLLFSHALRHVSAATAVVLALAEPVTAFSLAVLVVGERPGLAGLLGLAAVLAGL